MKKSIQLDKLITLDIFGYLIVLALVIAEHYFELMQIPSWVFTAFSTLIFLMCKEDRATRYYVMLVPFANAIHIKEVSMFYFVILLYKTLQKEQGAVFHRGTVVSFMIIICLQLLAGIRYEDSISTAVYLITVMGSVVLWGKMFFEEEICVRFIKSYLSAFVIMAGFMILLTIKVVPIEQLLKGYVRLGEADYFERDVFHTGANGLGMMCLFCSALICFLLYKGRVKRITAICVFIFLAITGMMTQSRAFLVGALFLVLYVTFFYSFSVVRALKIMSVVAAVCFVAIYIVDQIYPNLILQYSNRFEVQDLSNGRIDILIGYFESLISNPIDLMIGVGLSSYRAELGMEIGKTAHNATQEVMLAWGVIGLIAVIVWFVSMVKSRSLQFLPGVRAKALLPLYILLLMVQSTRMFSTYSSIFLVGIALFCIVPPKKQEGEDHENTIHRAAISYKSNPYR